MRKRSDTAPAARGPEPKPEARDAKTQPGAREAEAQPGAGIREQAEEGRGGRGRREVCYLRRHAWAVGRLLCGAGALAVLGTLRGEVPLLFALLALWGAGELLYGALRRRE